jgi:hypothetical protein
MRIAITDTTDIATNSNGERLPPPAPTSPYTCDPTNAFPPLEARHPDPMVRDEVLSVDSTGAVREDGNSLP